MGVFVLEKRDLLCSREPFFFFFRIIVTGREAKN